MRFKLLLVFMVLQGRRVSESCGAAGPRLQALVRFSGPYMNTWPQPPSTSRAGWARLPRDPVPASGRRVALAKESATGSGERDCDGGPVTRTGERRPLCRHLRRAAESLESFKDSAALSKRRPSSPSPSRTKLRSVPLPSQAAVSLAKNIGLNSMSKMYI